MTVEISDFPVGTPSRVGMRYGCYALFGLATVAILLRFYVRLFKLGVRRVGMDDLFVMGAWVSSVAVVAGVKLQFSSGIGWHAADIATLPNGTEILTKMVVWPWFCQILYFFQLGCIKASVVSLYLRLTVTASHRRVLWIALAIIFGQGLSSAIAVAGFICHPISIVWTGSDGGFGGPQCFNILAFNYYNAAFFILTDFLLAAAPLVVLKDMPINSRKKVYLATMSALGLLAIGGTISRQVTNEIAINDTADFTWTWAPAELCSVLESCLGIIFICVPAVAPLFTCLGESTKTGHQVIAHDENTPRTIGNLRQRPLFKPDDESFLFHTQVTAVDKADKRYSATAEFDHEMDDIQNSGDYASERSILSSTNGGHQVNHREAGPEQGIQVHQNVPNYSIKS